MRLNGSDQKLDLVASLVDANDDLNAFDPSPLRQVRQPINPDVVGMDIFQQPTVRVIDVMVWCQIRIVQKLSGVDDHFAYQTFLHEQTKGVVNGRFRNPVATLVDLLHQRVCRDVLRASKQYLADLNSLVSGDNAVIVQQCNHLSGRLGLIVHKAVQVCSIRMLRVQLHQHLFVGLSVVLIQYFSRT